MERNSLNIPTDTHGLIHETISSYLLGYLLTSQYKSFCWFHKGLANHRNEGNPLYNKFPRFKQETAACMWKQMTWGQ